MNGVGTTASARKVYKHVACGALLFLLAQAGRAQLGNVDRSVGGVDREVHGEASPSERVSGGMAGGRGAGKSGASSNWGAARPESNSLWNPRTAAAESHATARANVETPDFATQAGRSGVRDSASSFAIKQTSSLSSRGSKGRHVAGINSSPNADSTFAFRTKVGRATSSYSAAGKEKRAKALAASFREAPHQVRYRSKRKLKGKLKTKAERSKAAFSSKGAISGL